MKLESPDLCEDPWKSGTIQVNFGIWDRASKSGTVPGVPGRRLATMHMGCLSRLYLGTYLLAASMSFGVRSNRRSCTSNSQHRTWRSQRKNSKKNHEQWNIHELFSSLTQSLSLSSIGWWLSLCSGNTSRTVLIVALRRPLICSRIFLFLFEAPLGAVIIYFFKGTYIRTYTVGAW